MPRAGEEVERAAAVGAVGAGFQQGEVSGQRRRIAGDVHNALCAAGQQSRNHVGRQPLARRIDERDVHTPEGLAAGFDAFGRVAEEKARVGLGPAVAMRVFAGVFHRLGDNLRAEQAHAVASRTQADGSGAAVKVEQHVAGRGRGVGGRLRVKAFGHLGVDLIKGQRTDGKDPAAERVGQAVLAPQLDAGAAENDVRPLGVDVQPYAFDGGTARRQFVGEAVEGLRVAVRHDQHDAELAAAGRAQKDVAQQPFAGRLVVGADAARRQQRRDRLADGGEGGVLQQAAFLPHDAVRAARKKAGAERAGFVLGHRVDRLVAVVRPRAGFHTLAFERQPADAPQRVVDQLLFKARLGVRAQGGKAAAAAAAMLRTVGLDPVGRRREQRLEASDAVAGRRLDDFGADAVAGQRAGHKNHGALRRASDAAAVGRHVGDVQFDVCILLKDGLFVFFHRFPLLFDPICAILVYRTVIFQRPKEDVYENKKARQRRQNQPSAAVFAAGGAARRGALGSVRRARR